jgi:hypothetical protein
MCSADLLPIGNVPHKHAGTDDVLEARAGFEERRVNVPDGLNGLCIWVSDANDPSLSVAVVPET